MGDVKEMAWLSAQVPLELYDDFKSVAEENDRSVSAELRRLVRDHVDAAKRSAA